MEFSTLLRFKMAAYVLDCDWSLFLRLNAQFFYVLLFINEECMLRYEETRDNILLFHSSFIISGPSSYSLWDWIMLESP